MKPIIRKPKFMRSDEAMKAYLKAADIIYDEAFRPDIDPDQKYELMKKGCECFRKAAKAGGFFSIGDLHRWLIMH